jgi:DNA-binding protein HU-beta
MFHVKHRRQGSIALNMTQFVDKVAKDTGQPRQVVEEVLWSGIDTIAQVMAEREELSIVNFGTFYATELPAGMRRNPQTGAPVRMKKQTLPRFRPTGRVREVVRTGKAATLRKAPKGSLKRRS